MLCQEIFGVNATMRQVADYYAEEGYTVLVPDLFWRIAPGIELTDRGEDFQRALGLYQQFDEDKGVQDVGAALAALRQRPECVGQTGVLGFCLGGKLAYLAACRLPDVACAVGYYGVGIEHALSEAANIRGRLVLHVAERDGFCRPRHRRGSVRRWAAGPASSSMCTRAWTTRSLAPAGSTSTRPRH